MLTWSHSTTELLSLSDTPLKDPEERDVFEMHYCSIDDTVFPDEDFKKNSIEVYEFLFKMTVASLRSITKGLECDESKLLCLLTEKGECTKEADVFQPSKNTATNFCMFRYNDDKKLYKCTQKCMVHQDSGTITFLPRYSLLWIEFFLI